MRRLYNILAPLLLVLGFVGAIACDGDTPVTPKAECQTGSTKVKHEEGGTKLYECHNQEWVRVACFNGSAKTEVKKGKSIHYVCESNEWKRQP